MTQNQATAWQNDVGMAGTDTELSRSVAEMSRSGIRVAAIGTVPGRRQQYTPIFAAGTSAEHHPAAISYIFCFRNCMWKKEILRQVILPQNDTKTVRIVSETNKKGSGRHGKRPRCVKNNRKQPNLTRKEVAARTAENNQV